MRFKKGSRVEVINKMDVPISWHVAEILAGNGHTYCVRYTCHPGMISESRVERISRKFVRPCPPPTQGKVTWIVGDIVEVFEDFSWKIATILKVLQGDNYFVRLLGTSTESTIHKLNIRERWLWLDDKWILMGKSSGACGVMQDNKLSTSNFNPKMSFQVPQSKKRKQIAACLDIPKIDVLQESNRVSSRSLKRMSPYCSTVIESHTGNMQKIRVVENAGGKQKFYPNLSVEKVDAAAYPREILGAKYMHASFNNRTNGQNEPDGAVGCSLAESLETNDSDIDASSVGSCSVVSRRQKRLHSNFLPVSCRVTDSFCSDAESFCGPEDEEESYSLLLPPKEEVATGIHNLELHAYRCTLEALHASGPLSWEQETLLTNLRIMLHISNDEHLMELRNLLSAKTRTYIR